MNIDVSAYSGVIGSLTVNGNISQVRANGSINLNTGSIPTGQSNGCVSIGSFSGLTNQGLASTAIGIYSGFLNAGIDTVLLGVYAGSNNCGAGSVCIGKRAGTDSCPANTIVLNATGANLNPATPGLYISSIRGETGTGLTAGMLRYNATTREVTYIIS